MEVNVKLVGLL